MGLEAVQPPNQQLDSQIENSARTTPSGKGDEFASLISSAQQHSADPTSDIHFDLLKASLPEFHEAAQVSDLSQASSRSNPSQQAISEVLRYLTTHPEQVPADFLQSLGEYITLDAANDASVLSRTELDEQLKQHPEKVIFLNNFIDRVGISQGRRWVPDKDVATSVKEALLARSNEVSKGRLHRAFNVLIGRDVNLFQALTDQVENLYAAKIALERDIQEHKVILANTVKEIKNQEAESQFRALEENKKIVIEQIARQEQLIDELKGAQAEIANVRAQHADEVNAHHQKLGALEVEYQKSRSDYASRAVTLESEWLQKQAKGQQMLHGLSEKISDAENKSQIKIAEIETRYRILELELQAKLAASEAQYHERKTAIRTEMATLLETRDATLIERGINPILLNSLEEIEKKMITDIRNSVLFKRVSDHSLGEQVGKIVTVLAEVESSYGKEEAISLGKQAQNIIAEVFHELIENSKKRNETRIMEIIRLLSCPEPLKTRDFFDKKIGTGNNVARFEKEVTLFLDQYELSLAGYVELSRDESLRPKEYRLIQRLAESNQLEMSKIIPAFTIGFGNVASVDLTNLIAAGVTNGEELKNLAQDVTITFYAVRDKKDQALIKEILSHVPNRKVSVLSGANA